MKHIKAVILDWAGTSVDFGCMGPAKVFVEIFKRHQIQLTIEQARGPMGLAKKDHTRILLEMPEIAQQWFNQFGEFPGEKEVELLYSQLTPVMLDMIREFATPIPGLLDFTEKMKQQEIPIGTTTGYMAEIMEKLAPEAKTMGFVPDAMVSSTEVPEGRPAPYMCYANAIRLNVYPLNQMVKIGDTVADIQEGLNAGMWTIGLTKSGNEVGISLEDMKNADPAVLKNLIEKASRKLKNAGAHFVVDGIWDCLLLLEEIDKRIALGENPLPHFTFTQSQLI